MRTRIAMVLLDWAQISLELGTLGAKIIRTRQAPGSEMKSQADVGFWLNRVKVARLSTVREAFAIFHVLAGHNGCLDKCWHAALDEGERRLEQC